MKGFGPKIEISMVERKSGRDRNQVRPEQIEWVESKSALTSMGKQFRDLWMFALLDVWMFGFGTAWILILLFWEVWIFGPGRP
jgi:hypothetical protein